MGVLMDSLPQDDIEAIWGRIKYRLNLNEITGSNKEQVQKQVEQLMLSAYFPTRDNARVQQSPKFLVNKGFVGRALQSDRILEEIYSKQITSRAVRGKQRFIIKKGSHSFTSKSGKKFRAGQFLKGKSQQEATLDFIEKTKE